MNLADKIISHFPSDSDRTSGISLFSPLGNNSVIVKKSIGHKSGLSIHQNLIMNDFGGNPLAGKIFFIIPDDDL